ncbi:hypothetical protein Tco_0494252 [Tanacetum coccineum]
MTTRKSVGPLPARKIALRCVSPRSSNHRPSSSSSPMGSSPVNSLNLDAPDQAHFGSSTRVVSPRLESSAGDSLESAGMVERIESLRLENLKVRAIVDIKKDRVNSLRLYMSLSQEEFRLVRMDRDDTRRRLRRLESYLERCLGFRP